MSVSASNPTLLHTALKINVIFSCICAASLLLFPETMAKILGPDIPELAMFLLGVGLILFAIRGIWIFKKLPESIKHARILFYADVGWVVATPIVLPVANNFLTTLGIWIVIDIALIVAVIAWLEYAGIKRLQSEKGSVSFG